jgi:hypothetical protein
MCEIAQCLSKDLLLIFPFTFLGIAKRNFNMLRSTKQNKSLDENISAASHSAPNPGQDIR